jgi:hypothetical protein
MGRSYDSSQRTAAEPTPPAKNGDHAPEGMGLSSEHDEEQVQEVDSREEP